MEDFSERLVLIRTRLQRSQSLSDDGGAQVEPANSLDAMFDSDARDSLVSVLGGRFPRRCSVAHGTSFANAIGGGRKRMSVHATYIHKLRDGVHGDGQPLAALLEEGHARAGASKAEAIAASGRVAIVIDEGSAAVPLWKQGSMEENTPAAFAERGKLRDAHLVQAVLREFWQVTLRSVREAEHQDDDHHHDERDLPSSSAAPREATSDSALSFQKYRRLFLRVYRVLMEEDHHDAEEVILDDWQTDCRGDDTMSERQLGDSLFELVDLWCPTIDADAYADFLTALLHRVSTLYRVLDAVRVALRTRRQHTRTPPPLCD